MHHIRFLLIGMSIMAHSQIIISNDHETLVTPRRVTIWIPGTRGRSFLPTDIHPATKNVEQYICAAPRGLHKADMIGEYYQRIIAQTINHADPELFPADYFYIFGWQGDLDPIIRRNSSEELFSALMQLVAALKAQDISPIEITIITHSHGGNVALGIAEFAEDNFENLPFVVKKLIVMACPIQHQTAHCISHPIFEKIYGIYAPNDLMQTLDPQKIHHLPNAIVQAYRDRSWDPIKLAFKAAKSRPFFSQQTFNHHPKIMHICVHFNTEKPWSAEDKEPFTHFKDVIDLFNMIHIRFIIPSFLKQIPYILKDADMHQSHGCKRTKVHI